MERELGLIDVLIDRHDIVTTHLYPDISPGVEFGGIDVVVGGLPPIDCKQPAALFPLNEELESDRKFSILVESVFRLAENFRQIVS